jgi:hypothetical protein|tara:strand:- start:20060 stop:20641 length:582 start_codon:yes stop_codon:yes gene_type:complete
MAVAYTATVNGYSYQFDWLLQFIYTDSTLDSIPVEDLWTAIKEAQASQIGVVEERIASASGLDELDDGIETFLTMRLYDEWEIRSLKSSGKVATRGGNIVKENKKDPFFDDGTIFYVAFFSQAGVKTTISTGGSALTPTESAKLLSLPSATQVVDEFEAQSQADPTGFQVNVKEMNDAEVLGSGTNADKWRGE